MPTRRKAKLDPMTGFSGIEAIDDDPGFADNTRGNYFKRWTTVGLPDQGRNNAIDDAQQPVGSGAPETIIPGAPLKVPMEAEDIKRPKLREGREARKSLPLRKVALKICKLSPILARRLMATADELDYDDLSTARLELAGDETNAVDDSQDNNGHGVLKFWGTDPARKTSLPRESSRRRNACSVKQLEGGDYILQDEGGFKVDGPFSSKSEAEKAQASYMKDLAKEQGKEATLEYASRGASRRRSGRRVAEALGANSPGLKDIDWTNTLKKVEHAIQGHYDPGAVANILESDYKRTRQLLDGNRTSPTQAADPHVRQGDTLASRAAGRKKAGVDWIDIENAADDFTRTGKSPEEITVVDVARALGLNHGDANRALGPIRKKMEDQGRQDPRDRDPQPNQMLGSRKKKARSQGDRPLHPEPVVGDEDGPGADGAGGFADRSKAPLQETMTADDVPRPRIRENPEASRSLWAAFKAALAKDGPVAGEWNDGSYEVATKDYGNTLEVTASVRDREGIETPVGTMTLSLLNDSPDGRYASVELNDDLIEKRVTDFTLKRKQAGRLASWITREAVDISRGALEHMAP